MQRNPWPAFLANFPGEAITCHLRSAKEALASFSLPDGAKCFSGGSLTEAEPGALAGIVPIAPTAVLRGGSRCPARSADCQNQVIGHGWQHACEVSWADESLRCLCGGHRRPAGHNSPRHPQIGPG